MSLLGATSITRRRTADGSYSSTTGRYTEGSTTDTTITASVQPLNGRDRQVLPEGLRASDTRKIYTEDDLRAEPPADQVQIDGEWFTVRHVDTSHPLIGHTRAYVAREATS